MAKVTIGYDHPNYVALCSQLSETARHNGLWYYAHTLQDKLVPLIRTNRPVDVIGKQACGTEDHAIVFIHTNVPCEKEYPWLANYKDLILVTSIPQTQDILQSMFPQHKVILLPVSIDSDQLAHLKDTPKDQEAGYFGNAWKFKQKDLQELVPPEVHRFGTMPREQMLEVMAHYKKVYAVGLTAIEAQFLGAEILQCDSRFPDPMSTFHKLDYREAANMLQAQLDEIDTVEYKKPITNHIVYTEPQIITHDDPVFQDMREKLGERAHNGGYYYSKEITDNIIPNVQTDRSWITVCMKGKIVPHSIFFVHATETFEQYEWMKTLPEMDIVAVCSKKSSMLYFEKLRCVSHSIFLPLSVDTKYIKQFKQKKKTKDTCFYGNKWPSRVQYLLPKTNSVPHIQGARDECLEELAKYKQCYAIDRCALEAKTLGVDVLPTDARFDPDIFRVYDNREAALILQSQLDYIDKEF